MKSTSIYNNREKQLDHNIGFLPPPPQVILKKIDPTNYQENNKLYIAPTRVKTELQKVIMQIDEGRDAEQAKKVVRSVDEERKRYIQLAMSLRKGVELNKIIADSSIDIFLHFNLGHIYTHLGLERYSLFSYEKVIRSLNDHCIKLKYLEIVPTNYFATNHKFYSQMTQRFWSHLLRGRSNLALSTAYSAAMIHEEAYQLSMEAYLDFLKAAHELLIVFIGSLLKFMVKNKYKIRDRNGPHSKKSSRARVNTDEEPFIEIEFQNYEICVNTLHLICSKIEKDSSDPKFQMLKTIIEDQTRTLLGYTEYSFTMNSKQKNDFLTEKQKKMRFLDLTTPKNLEKYKNFDEAQWSSVNIEIDYVYELTMFIVASLYALSIEAKFNDEPKPETHELLKQFGVQAPKQIYHEKMKNGKMNRGKISESEHWLSRALSLSHEHLPHTSLFFQIKNIYTSTYATKVEEEIIQEVSEDNQQATVIMASGNKNMIGYIRENGTSKKSKELKKAIERNVQSSENEPELQKSRQKMHKFLQIQDSDQEILNLLSKKQHQEGKMKKMLKDEDKRRNHQKLEEIGKNKKISKQKRSWEEKQKQRVAMTAPTNQIYESWRFTMSQGKNNANPPAKAQNQKDYEIKTLKYGNQMIPMVLRQYKDEDPMKQKKSRYAENDQRDNKYYMRSLDAKVQQKAHSTSHKKRKWESHLEELKKTYDTTHQINRGDSRKGRNSISYTREPKRGQNFNQPLFNAYGEEQQQQPRYTRQAKFNTIDARDKEEKKRNIGYARYELKHLKAERRTGDEWMVL